MKWRSLQESGSYSDMRPLREIFAERKEAIAKYVPADVQAVHARTVAGLKALGLAAQALGLQSARSLLRSNFRITTASAFLPPICSAKDGWWSVSFAGAGVRSASGRWRR